MKKDMKFEEAMQLLEDKISRLEGGSLTLDESISEFEEAIKLIAFCNKRLESAERKVRILTESIDGTVTDAPFDSDSDEA